MLRAVSIHAVAKARAGAKLALRANASAMPQAMPITIDNTAISTVIKAPRSMSGSAWNAWCQWNV